MNFDHLYSKKVKNSSPYLRIPTPKRLLNMNMYNDWTNLRKLSEAEYFEWNK